MLKRSPVVSMAVSQLLAQSVANQQLIVPHESTPLYDLASACFGIYGFSDNLGEDRVGKASFLVDNAIVNSCEADPQVLDTIPHENFTEVKAISAHTARYTGYAVKVAESIKRTLVLSEEAAEKIKAVFDEVNTKYSVSDRVIPIKIVTLIGGGDLGEDSNLVELAKSIIPEGAEPTYSGMVPAAFPRIENLDDFPVAELIKTNVRSVDEHLKEWALNGGAALLHAAYNQSFANNDAAYLHDGYYPVDHAFVSGLDPNATELDTAVALLLLTMNLEKVGITFAPTKLSLEEIEYGLVRTKLFAAHVIVSYADKVRVGREQGKVVYSYPRIIGAQDDWANKVYEIVVDKVAYAQFLDEGGSPEVLFGSYTSQHLYFKNELLANAAGFIQNWSEREGVLRHERNQTEIARLYNDIRARIQLDFNNLNAAERGAISSDSVHHELEIFNKHLTTRGLTYLYDLVRELYTSVFYAGTEVQCLLRCIDEVKVDASASRDVILRVALIEYTTKWLMEQTQSIEFIEGVK